MALWRSMRYASTTRILKSEVKDIVFHFAVEEYLHLSGLLKALDGRG